MCSCRLASSFVVGAIAFASLLPAAACGQSEPQSRASRSDSRLELLCKALQKKDTDLQRRAVQELGELAPADGNAAAALLDYFISDGGQWDTIGALASLGYGAVSKVTTIPHENELYNKTLYLLGTIGPKAKEAVPFLLKALSKPDLHPILKTRTVVALVRIGHDSNAANLAALRQQILDGNDEGWLAADFLVKTGGASLADDAIVALATKHLEPNDPRRSQATAALGTIGERSKPAVVRLQQMLGRAERDADNGDWEERNDTKWVRLECLFALASILEDKRFDLLRQYLRIASRIENHTDWAAFGLLASGPPQVRKAVPRFVSDKDDDVAFGAVTTVEFLGIPARQSQKVLLEILASDRKEELRQRAAMAIGRVADLTCLPELRAQFKKEQSTDVRDAIRRAIDLLELREPEP